MKKILIVDDAMDVHILVRRALPLDAVSISAYTLTEAQHRLQCERFDLLLLDVNLPDGSGFDFFKQFNFENGLSPIPIIFLTGKTSQEDRLKGLALGADDYIVKPFDLNELRLRINNRLLRAGHSGAAPNLTQNTLILGDVKFEHSQQRALHLITLQKEIPLKLTPTGYKILLLLAHSLSETFTREQIILSVWGEGFHITHRTVDSYIRDIRKELEPTLLRITSEYGAGYKLSIL